MDNTNPNSTDDSTTNDEQDEPNKHSNNINSLKRKLVQNLPQHLSNGEREDTDTPQSKLARFITDGQFEINGNLCSSRVFVNGGQTFHVSLSLEEACDAKDVTFSKSYDCSDEAVLIYDTGNITRSASEDLLQRPTATLQRRFSMFSASKGKLIAVQKIRPGEKSMRSPSQARSPSTGSQTPFLKPPAKSDGDDDVPTKFTRHQKLIAFCLCLADFTTFLSMSIIAPFFPREAAAKGMREAVSGFVFSIYALVVMLASPIFGRILPHVGAKFMFLTGVGFCGACNILFGLLDNVDGNIAFTVLCFLVRSFEALGAAAFCTASCTILIDQFPDDIGTVFGFTETCIGVGMSIGPAIGGVLYAAGGFGLPFFALGGFVMAIVPLCWYLMRNLEDPKQVLSSPVSYKKLLSMPHVVVVLLILFVASQAQGFIDPTLEPHMRQEFNLNTSIVGMLFLLLAGAYAISSPVVGWISGKVENKYPIMIVGLIFVTVSMSLLGPADFLPFNGTLWLTILSLVLMGFSFAAAYIPTFESIFIAAMNGGLEDDINTYSVVSGLWTCVYSLGEVTGPSLGGILSDFLTFPQASTLMAFCTLAAFVVSIIAWSNPCACFGPYSLIEDAEERLAEKLQEEEKGRRPPSREHTPLQDACVHSYGSFCDDRKNPTV